MSYALGHAEPFPRHFAHKTPLDCETNDIDHELCAGTPSQARIESAGEEGTRGVLPLMIQAALFWLDRNPGINRINDVQKVNQFLPFLSHQRDSLHLLYICIYTFTHLNLTGNS